MWHDVGRWTQATKLSGVAGRANVRLWRFCLASVEA